MAVFGRNATKYSYILTTLSNGSSKTLKVIPHGILRLFVMKTAPVSVSPLEYNISMW